MHALGTPKLEINSYVTAPGNLIAEDVLLIAAGKHNGALFSGLRIF